MRERSLGVLQSTLDIHLPRGRRLRYKLVKSAAVTALPRAGLDLQGPAIHQFAAAEPGIPIT